jgi:membrane protein YdbS with pleckstrin-like domain
MSSSYTVEPSRVWWHWAKVAHDNVMMVYCTYIIFNTYASKLARFLYEKQEFLQEKKKILDKRV